MTINSKNTDNKNKMELEKYSTDASIFKVVPENVFEFDNFDDIKDLIKNEKPFSVRGAGTCMSGGSLTYESVVHVKEKNIILNKEDFDAEGSIWVHTNIYIKDLLGELKRHNRFFAPYTSSKDLCTLAGMLGNNASGEKSFLYGPTSHNVTELKVLINTKTENNIYRAKEKEIRLDKNNNRVYEYDFEKEIIENIINNYDIINDSRINTKKNAAGYNIFDIYNKDKNTFNLTPLFIGAQGTLGIITEAKIKTFEIKNNPKMIVIPFDDLHLLSKIIKVGAKHNPTSIECFDNHTYDLAKIHMNEDAAHTYLSKNKKLTIFIEWENGEDNESIRNIDEFLLEMKTENINAYRIEKEEERNSYWNIRRASFKLLKDFAPTGHKAIPIIEDTIVNIEHYDEYLKELILILNNYDMTYTYAGHIGDGSIRLIPLIKKDQKNAKENILKLAEEVYDLVSKYKGSISCDHNDGLARTYMLEKVYNKNIINIFKDIKAVLDKNNIFNPGKKICHSDFYNNEKEAREYALSKINLD